MIDTSLLQQHTQPHMVQLTNRGSTNPCYKHTYCTFLNTGFGNAGCFPLSLCVFN